MGQFLTSMTNNEQMHDAFLHASLHANAYACRPSVKFCFQKWDHKKKVLAMIGSIQPVIEFPAFIYCT
uniref:Uncharacterized protein n=1 Tax=Pararge aegeria TaxID=116150 RepID=S4P5Q7_9NEOP